jgi:hypothetical protein
VAPGGYFFKFLGFNEGVEGAIGVFNGPMIIRPDALIDQYRRALALESQVDGVVVHHRG